VATRAQVTRAYRSLPKTCGFQVEKTLLSSDVEEMDTGACL
jgi:hypothetical protein